MNHDIREPLDQIAAGAAGATRRSDRGALDPATLVAGAARRRRVHRLRSGAAVAVAAGVLVAGVQLTNDRGDGVAPAEPTSGTGPADVRCGAAIEDVPPLDLDVRATSSLSGPVPESGGPEVDERRAPDGVYDVGEPVTVTADHEAGPGVETTGLEREFTVVVVQNGSVVGVAEPGQQEAGDPPFPGDLPPLGGTYGLLACDATGPSSEPLGPGTYELYGVLTVPNDSAGNPVSGAFLTDPLPLEIRAGGSSGWYAVDAVRLPEEVPLLPGPVLLIEEHEPSGKLSVVVEAEAGRDTAAQARRSLLDAGFRLEDEQTDDERPFWWFGEFRSAQWRVTVDVSNETGGGFYTQYVIERTP